MKKKVSVFLLSSVLMLSSGAFVSASNNMYSNDIITSSSEQEGINNLDGEYTLSRGYQMINGNVHDRYGNVVIEMKDGLTPDGYTLSSNFSILYGESDNVYSNDIITSSSEQEGINSLDSEYTLARGYQMINGNVHDKYGNVVIEMKDGLTPDGYTLSSNFSIVYGEAMDDNETSISSRTTDVFSGTKAIAQNVTGTEGTKLGSDFSFTSSEPNFFAKYSSGTISGVNFGLNNVTTSESVAWFSNIGVGEINTYYGAYNSLRPNDTFEVKASGQGGSGNVTVLVQKK
jgi:hypothetical protein